MWVTLLRRPLKPIVASSGESNLAYRGSVVKVDGPGVHRETRGRYMDRWPTNSHQLGPGEDALGDGKYRIPAPLNKAFSRGFVL